MHFSRMRTVRFSGRLEGGVCQGDVCLPGCVWLSMGCVCPGSVCLPRGVCLPEVCVYQGLSAGGGGFFLPGGVSTRRVSACQGVSARPTQGQNDRHV